MYLGPLIKIYKCDQIHKKDLISAVTIFRNMILNYSIQYILTMNRTIYTHFCTTLLVFKAHNSLYLQYIANWISYHSSPEFISTI